MEINASQLSLVNKQITRLFSSQNFYGKKLKEAGVEQLASKDDFEKLPFSEKSDLREAYPLGLMAWPEEEVVRILSS